MRIRIAALAAESAHCFIEIGSDVPFSVVAAVMEAVAKSALPTYGVTVVESSFHPPAQVSRNLDPAMYGESAKLALDAITDPPIVKPPVQEFKYVEVPNAPIQGEFCSAIADVKTITLVPVDPEPTEAQKDAQAALTKVKPEVLAKESLEAVRASSVKELAATLPPDNPLAQAMAAPAEAPKKRTRKAAAESASIQADPAVSVQAVPAPVSPNAVIPESQRATTLPAQPVTPPARKKMLSKEEEDLIRPRLASYRTRILTTEGGMAYVLDFGDPQKQMKEFFQAFRKDKPNTFDWTYIDWLKLLDFLDDGLKNLGARGLTRYIQQVIGLVPNPDDGSEARVRK